MPQIRGCGKEGLKVLTADLAQLSGCENLERVGDSENVVAF